MRRLVARYDDASVVAYQAFDADLGAEIVGRGTLAGGWRYDRHTRLQTSWAFAAERYADRAHVVAIRIAREGFDALLTAALLADYDEGLYKTRAAWRLATRFAPVLVEWAADTPRLVVHGPLVRRLATEWVQEVSDVTRAVRDRLPAEERDYPVPADVARRIGLSS